MPADTSRSIEKQIEEWLAQMTLEEKVAMTAGSDMWHSTGVERLGIPPFKVTDGPNGARGASWRGAVTSACFPVGVALAATWNPELIYRVGVALGEEVKAKSAHILLAPTVNIHRSPLGGRNFECYSEDPYLTSRIAVAYIQGVQSQGVGACIKHFVCNDSEFERHTISSEVRERALREIYLPPFKAAVKEADVWAVMGAYNRLNGTYCCENRYLLSEILKGEWGFQGIVISDWGATKSTAASANAGLDLEMPGPARLMGPRLLQAVKDGQVSEEVIDDKVRRLLRIVLLSGVMEHPEEPEKAIDKPEHRALIREVAGEGIVLLKNEGDLLPLDERKIKSVAVIGPNAKAARVMGGGSAKVTPHYVVSPLEGILSRCGDRIQVRYEQGCANYKRTPVLEAAWLTPAEGEGTGLTCEYYNNPDLSGEPVATEMIRNLHFFWAGEVAPGVDPNQFSARLHGTLTVPETGTYTFSLTSAGLSRLYIDGKEVVDNWTEQRPGEAFFGMGSEEKTGQMELTAGRAYEIKIEYSKRDPGRPGGLTVGCLPPVAGDALERAVQLAAQSDVALVFVGTNDEWESEGYDRTDMELPGRQNELVERVVAANPNTVVILQSGAPVTMPWLDEVPAVLEAWFSGQECGNAIADVLFGDVNPSGKLPTTFPKRLEDNPAYINYPGEKGQVFYGEGIFVGYRYYDKKKIEPLFPFGHGLSYTTFAYSNLRLSASEIDADGKLQVSVDVQNTGTRAGKEVVQLYVRDVEAGVMRPEKELKGFQKIALEPSETKTVTFTLDREALSYYDPVQKAWVAEAGEFEVLIGSSSRDIRLRGTFTLKTTALVGPDGQPIQRRRLSIKTPLRELLADEAARAILEKHLGSSRQAALHSDFVLGLSLEELSRFAPELLTSERLQAIEVDLAKL
ncbi:MAG TPA: beta-glucosidase [Caldilineae bacterium]|nr:beta-glucosidase [Caldilineae bacterium]